MSKLSALLLPLALASCAAATPPSALSGPKPNNATDRAMAQLAERALDTWLSLRPVHATYLGYPKYRGRLPDYSEEAVARARARLTDLVVALKKIERDALSPPWRVDRDLLQNRIEKARFFFATLKPFTWDVQLYNEAVGGGLYYLTVPPADPADWPEQLSALLSRLEALPRFLEVARARLEAPPRAFTEFVIAQNPGNIDTIESRLPELFEPYPKLKARFERVGPEAVAAVRAFQSYLEEELLPRSTGDWRLGRVLWERKLRLTLESEMTSEAIREGARRGLDRARFQMYDVALPLYRELFPEDDAYLELTGDARINHVVGRVIGEASKQHPPPDGLFEAVKTEAERIKAFIRESGLVKLPPPDDPFVIEPTPAYLDGLAVAFFNPAPAFQPERKKSFWISSVPEEDTESYLREYNDFILRSLTIHEAFPGHYVQLYWSSHSDWTSATKRALESGTMAEGWAVMIERLMHEAGYGEDDPRNLLFHLKMRLRVFINALIDARLHTSDEPEEELDAWALDLMMTKGFQERAEAVRKLRRAKLTSTQLSTYYVGYREMLGIYEDGEATAGEGFDQQAFLMKMMSFGTIPPAMIRRLLAAEGAL